MREVVWTLPFLSSGLRGVDFQKLVGRSCALTFDDSENSPVRLVFEGVEAFKCTYHNACSREMVATYDKLTDLGRTQWLSESPNAMALINSELACFTEHFSS
jgi:hypothetical protein